MHTPDAYLLSRCHKNSNTHLHKHNAFAHTCAHIYTWLCKQTCTHKGIHMRLHMHAQKYAHTNSYVCTQSTHPKLDTHTYTHTQTHFITFSYSQIEAQHTTTSLCMMGEFLVGRPCVFEFLLFGSGRIQELEERERQLQSEKDEFDNRRGWGRHHSPLALDRMGSSPG